MARRRYGAGINNLLKLYLSICDYWLILDNSEPPLHIIGTDLKLKMLRLKMRIFTIKS